MKGLFLVFFLAVPITAQALEITSGDYQGREDVAAFVARNIASKESSKHDMSLDVSVRGLLDKYGDQWANQALGLPVLVEEAKMTQLRKGFGGS